MEVWNKTLEYVKTGEGHLKDSRLVSLADATTHVPNCMILDGYYKRFNGYKKIGLLEGYIC